MTANIQSLLDECKERGIKASMRDLARAIGVHYSTVVKIKRGEIANPRIEILQSISDYFSKKLKRHITIDELVGRKEVPEVRKEEIQAGLKQSKDEIGVTNETCEALLARIGYLENHFPERRGEIATLRNSLEYIQTRLNELQREAGLAIQEVSRVPPQNVTETGRGGEQGKDNFTATPESA